MLIADCVPTPLWLGVRALPLLWAGNFTIIDPISGNTAVTGQSIVLTVRCWHCHHIAHRFWLVQHHRRFGSSNIQHLHHILHIGIQCD
jgi:hypothetical protein